MNGYLYVLSGVSVLIALLCVLTPAHAQQHIKLLCSLCVVCLICAPVAELAGKIASGDWEIPDAWIGQEDQEEQKGQDREQLAQSMLAGQLQLALEQQFDLTADQCRIYAEWGDDGGLQHVTLILSGKAIWMDPDPIRAYVQELLGCRCTVVLD